MLKDLSDLARALHQAAYDYLWDRFGMYVGTFRVLVLALANVDVIVNALIRVGTGADGSLLRAVVDVVLQAGLMWFFFGRHHLGEEWTQQDQGRLQPLNTQALRSQNSGPIVRIAVTMLAPALWIWSGRTDLIGVRIAALIGFIMWTYSCEVMVRERNPDRFKELAPQAT